MTLFFSGSITSVKEVKKPDNLNKSVKKRTLQIEITEKWKTTSLVQYDAQNWLSIQPDNNNKNFSKQYIKNFAVSTKIISIHTWSKDGCVRLQISAAVEHATGGPHKVPYNKFFTKKGLGPRERTVKVGGWQETEQMSLVKSFDIVQSANFEKNKMKFETAYFTPK